MGGHSTAGLVMSGQYHGDTFVFKKRKKKNMKVSCSQDIKNLPQELQTNTWVGAKHLNMIKIYWHRSPYERMQYLRHRANERTKGIR